jgi:hypothetical protein
LFSTEATTRLGVQVYLLDKIAEGITVDYRPGEGKTADGVVGLSEQPALHVEHFRHRDIAVLGNEEPEDGVVAEARS